MAEAFDESPVPADGRPMPSEILDLRGTIDNIDAALVHLLAERFRATQRVGELKATSGMPPADPTRDRQQIERLKAIASGAGLDPEFAEQFRNFIVSEVIRHHERIAAEHAAGRRAGEAPTLDTYS
ncbi:chorismate mutase [Isoptericola jiangsuensis]|uniref:Chorismate mutase n=1 Tax=Isoptericola jiangsuensis TaxID=548579 RepID=A0A2A9EWN6_9MICO|nr:chorismate mutase [Isoptericola jiangsuensis]PFG42700.1 chorismate mutase [Isoptericola jiangsuensis]